MGAYGVREGNARGAQPYARLRWQEPWGVGVHARGQGHKAEVPSIWGASEIREHALMRMHVRMHASAPKPQLICILIYRPFGLC